MTLFVAPLIDHIVEIAEEGELLILCLVEGDHIEEGIHRIGQSGLKTLLAFGQRSSFDVVRIDGTAPLLADEGMEFP